MEIQKTGERQNVHPARSMDRESGALDLLQVLYDGLKLQRQRVTSRWKGSATEESVTRDP